MPSRETAKSTAYQDVESPYIRQRIDAHEVASLDSRPP